MAEPHSLTDATPDLGESPTFADQEVLERAIVKLALLGQQVGVSVDQMIALLESGLSVVELVEYMAARNRQCRCD